ncbi:hypothetical protein SAMN05216296_0094 [Pseudomonas pohangensis]|uniref:Uncharacterized protein n=1 Tax=Pseudomonas pohangensis TaxID=364197 RepID=A0A1H2DWA9_9PSED|nr:hypothetical protein [Pseudomonas pohangensis]SDT87155.1 hypothetical protein SAMN05216296_0094 [Pseudomonas pohangensis]
MRISEFRAIQRECSNAYLHSLVMTCRRKFLCAAKLLELQSAAISRLRDFGLDGQINIWPLYSPYEVLSERYLELFYSPQLEIFRDRSNMQDEKWFKYFHHALIPTLIADDEIVRNVLRSVGGLPSKQPKDAAMALKHYFSEMTLPDSAPLWAPEESFDN